MLEAVSGLTYLALQQDFAAKILADNLCAALARADVPEHAHSRPNRTYPLGALRSLLSACLLGVAHALDALGATIQAMDRVRCRIQPREDTIHDHRVPNLIATPPTGLRHDAR